jgi:hypothetical protein
MTIYISAIVGLVIWIVLWAIDVKALDGFLITIAIVLGATVAWMAGPYVKNLLRP